LGFMLLGLGLGMFWSRRQTALKESR